jgi:hypothetical protein
MRGLNNRVAALEADGGIELSPAAKVWLGRPLTDTEQRMLDTVEPVSVDGIDASKFSKEAREWLGID